MASILSETQSLDTSNLLGSTENDCHLTDKSIFLHGNCCIFLEIPFNLVNDVFQIFLAATKQLYEGFSPSVCLSVCLSVTPLSPCSPHCTILKFSRVITNHKSDVHAKGQGQRSKVKVTDLRAERCCRSLNALLTMFPSYHHEIFRSYHRGPG